MTSAATEPGWEVAIAVPSTLVDDAGALLVDEGALGCEQQSADTPRPTFAHDPLPAVPRADAADGLATLIVSFDGNLDRHEVEERSAAALMALGVEPPASWEIVKRTDVDWAERWKEHFRPLHIGRRLWVLPTWESGERPPAGALVVTLDPGLAFGTGQHATTALCLELLEGGLAAGDAGARVLDVGCGSGILAIAAALLGSRDVLAIDNDPTAVTVAHENIAQNGVGDVVRASGDDLRAVPGVFDWVLANIIAPVLVELAEPLVAHTARGGALVLSGVLDTQEAEVLAAIRDAAKRLGRPEPVVAGRRQRDEWVALRLAVG